MGKQGIVSKDILNQIDLSRSFLEGNPKFNLARAKRKERFLQKNANKHSVKIEFPHGGRIRGRRERNAALKNLFEAQKHLADNYSGNFTEENIKMAGGLINGMAGGSMYRTCSARTLAYDGMPFTYPGDVLSKMDVFLQENYKFNSVVEKAIHAHFNIAKIHPFNDGNGRLSRLVQNVALDNEGFPPIVVYSQERGNYLELIGKASREAREKSGNEAQTIFYNYLATKVLSSLNSIRANCKC
jgi:hypothetical protein